jgi:UDP-N-acetylmuramoyl-L-alanyl-D-glutamate--2,6-diaminopimelate ligase
MTEAPMNIARPKTLGEIARAVGALDIRGDSRVVVSGVRQDSRRVERGELFAIRGGAKTSGWNYVRDAIARGASAVMAESTSHDVTIDVPLIVVADAREAIARAAHFVYGDPSRDMAVVGITGTNGKTTTSMLVCRALEANGHRPGLMGTLAYKFEDLAFDAAHTTPEADEVARVAGAMRDRGASHLVMEISSHALSQKRSLGLHVQVAALTNLTQDHLDFHGSMEAYGAAKAQLFFEYAPPKSVVNVDDPFGCALADRIAKARGRASVITVSCEANSAADVAPREVELGAKGTRASVRTPSGDVAIETSLIGAHNLANALLCVGISSALGLDLKKVAAVLTDIVVPGRLERCDGASDDVVVAVDYAHTPDALDRVLSALDSLQSRDESGAVHRRVGGSSRAAGASSSPSASAKKGRLICIFGCGGDRDPTKREPMGRAVATWADVAVVTTDNSRSEDPAAIAKAILPGLAKAGRGEGVPRVVVELDRARAIAQTIDEAKSGDVVLIAGKGHETYQIIDNVSRHFDDREEARKALSARRARAKGGA